MPVTRLRLLLAPTHTRPNDWARRSFIAASGASGIGFALSGVTVFLNDVIQWAFTLLFWIGLVVAIPALLAVLVTAAVKPRDPVA